MNKMNNKLNKQNYNTHIFDIGNLFNTGRQKAFQRVNKILIETYWNTGKRIVEFEQDGNEKAEYGSKLLKKLSIDLKQRLGRGFSKSNIYLMRQFYIQFPKFQTLSGILNWSHYAELVSVSDDLAHSFYYNQCLNENWSVRELKRQRNSALFERIALSKEKEEKLYNG